MATFSPAPGPGINRACFLAGTVLSTAWWIQGYLADSTKDPSRGRYRDKLRHCVQRLGQTRAPPWPGTRSFQQTGCNLPRRKLGLSMFFQLWRTLQYVQYIQYSGLHLTQSRVRVVISAVKLCEYTDIHTCQCRGRGC